MPYSAVVTDKQVEVNQLDVVFSQGQFHIKNN